MNEVDPVKQLSLLEELKYIDAEQVEAWSRMVLDDLVSWSNSSIFQSRGGKISLDFPLGAPNAGVRYDSYEPLQVSMMIRQSMLTDIYRDAFTFPLICKRLVSETPVLDSLHQDQWTDGHRYLFSTGIPDLSATAVHFQLKPFCESMIKVYQDRADNRLEPNDLRCRFVMFELMLVWTFFHELGHVVQRHFQLWANPFNTDRINVFPEFDEGVPCELADSGKAQPATPDFRGQARELMADAEAVDLTLRYLLETRRLNFSMVYLLLCSISCMYQRFYINYSDDLTITCHRHPHPAVRDDVSQVFIMDSICDVLLATKQCSNRDTAIIPVTYMSVRASLFTGLFRSQRVERREDSSSMPTYMRLQTETHSQELESYLKVLMPHIEDQIHQVITGHLLSDHRLNDWLMLLRARTRSHGVHS